MEIVMPQVKITLSVAEYESLKLAAATAFVPVGTWSRQSLLSLAARIKGTLPHGTQAIPVLGQPDTYAMAPPAPKPLKRALPGEEYRCSLRSGGQAWLTYDEIVKSSGKGTADGIVQGGASRRIRAQPVPQPAPQPEYERAYGDEDLPERSLDEQIADATQALAAWDVDEHGEMPESMVAMLRDLRAQRHRRDHGARPVQGPAEYFVESSDRWLTREEMTETFGEAFANDTISVALDSDDIASAFRYRGA